jgi:hypothetical protein
MNYYIKHFIGIVLLVFVFTSCDKDSVTSTSNSQSNEPKSVAPGGGSGGTGCCKNYMTLLDQGAGEWCCSSGTNCLPCVTITSSSSLIASFELSISGGADGVKDYFLGDEYLDLFPALEDNPYNMLTKLQSGNYEIEKIFDPEDNNHVIYKAYNQDGDYFGLPIMTE